MTNLSLQKRNLFSETENKLLYEPKFDDESFYNMIYKTISRCKIKEKYKAILTDEESLCYFKKAFTSKTYNKEDNYEVLEMKGDAVIRHFIKKYMYVRFPQLNCPLGVKVVARLSGNFESKESFYPISLKLGFWPFIASSQEQRDSERKSLLEDVFEAFIGAFEEILDNRIRRGVGYAIVYDLLESIFNDIPISLDYYDLIDAKTLLKELFDKHGRNKHDKISDLGHEKYKNTRNGDFVTSEVYMVTGGVVTGKKKTKNIEGGIWKKIGHGQGSLQQAAEQKAAKEALLYLKKMGYYREPPPEYALFSKQSS